MHVLSLNYNLYKTNRFQVAVHPGGGGGTAIYGPYRYVPL